MRLIDADALLERMTKAMESGSNLNGTFDLHIEHSPIVSVVQGWIPCGERLPNTEYGEGDSVLCCTESGLMYILYWDSGNWRIPTGEPYIWVNHATGWHDKVIAWMPLPEPYKGGDDK